MAKDKWYERNAGAIVQGVGALAGAYGQYQTDTARNKMIDKQFNYQVAQDKLALSRYNKAQTNLDDAFADSSLNPKKKKKKKDTLGNEIEDTTQMA